MVSIYVCVCVWYVGTCVKRSLRASASRTPVVKEPRNRISILSHDKIALDTLLTNLSGYRILCLSRVLSIYHAANGRFAMRCCGYVKRLGISIYRYKFTYGEGKIHTVMMFYGTCRLLIDDELLAYCIAYFSIVCNT